MSQERWTSAFLNLWGRSSSHREGQISIACSGRKWNPTEALTYKAKCFAKLCRSLVVGGLKMAAFVTSYPILVSLNPTLSCVCSKMTFLWPVVSWNEIWHIIAIQPRRLNMVGKQDEIHKVAPLGVFPLANCFPLVMLPEGNFCPVLGGASVLVSFSRQF